MKCFSLSFLNSNHNLNLFFHASLNTQKLHIKGTQLTNNVFTLWSVMRNDLLKPFLIIYVLMIIYAWLSTTQKKVGKLLFSPQKNTPFGRFVQWTVLKCVIVLDVLTERRKKRLHPLSWWKCCIFRIGGELFLSTINLNFWLA